MTILYASAHSGIVPAKRAVAVPLEAGQSLRITNTHGSQVVDTWAFNQNDLREFMSMEHSRASMLKVNPVVGDTLVTNHRRPILTLAEDTTLGVHDTLIAACDRYRYLELGGGLDHANCTDNLNAALTSLGYEINETPSPLNLFMNVHTHGDGHIEFLAPVSKPGEYVSLRAEMDLILVMSACPQDITLVNALNPMDVHYAVAPIKRLWCGVPMCCGGISCRPVESSPVQIDLDQIE
jgi:uncharacterized protein YcgI (DUF1989 family)